MRNGSSNGVIFLARANVGIKPVLAISHPSIKPLGFVIYEITGREKRARSA